MGATARLRGKKLDEARGGRAPSMSAVLGCWAQVGRIVKGGKQQSSGGGGGAPPAEDVAD